MQENQISAQPSDSPRRLAGARLTRSQRSMPATDAALRWGSSTRHILAAIAYNNSSAASIDTAYARHDGPRILDKTDTRCVSKHAMLVREGPTHASTSVVVLGTPAGACLRGKRAR